MLHLECPSDYFGDVSTLWTVSTRTRQDWTELSAIVHLFNNEIMDALQTNELISNPFQNHEMMPTNMMSWLTLLHVWCSDCIFNGMIIKTTDYILSVLTIYQINVQGMLIKLPFFLTNCPDLKFCEFFLTMLGCGQDWFCVRLLPCTAVSTTSAFCHYFAIWSSSFNSYVSNSFLLSFVLLLL